MPEPAEPKRFGSPLEAARRLLPWPRAVSGEALYFAGMVYLIATLLALLLFRSVYSSESQEAVVPLPSFETEVALGRFSCVHGRHAVRQDAQVPDPIVVMEFDAAGVVRGSLPRIQAIETSVARYDHRIRQFVAEAARSITHDELREDDLASFRRRLEEGVNGLVGQPILTDVVIKNFRHFELQRPYVDSGAHAPNQPRLLRPTFQHVRLDEPGETVTHRAVSGRPRAMLRSSSRTGNRRDRA